MEERDELPETLQFIRLLWQLDHALNKRSRRLLRDAGVTAPQRFLIKVVGMRPGCTPGELARFLHVTPATVTRVVQRMQAAGLLRREPDQEDSRRVRLHLTLKGRRVDERCSGPTETPVGRVLRNTPRARLVEAQRLLTELVASLEAP